MDFAGGASLAARLSAVGAATLMETAIRTDMPAGAALFMAAGDMVAGVMADSVAVATVEEVAADATGKAPAAHSEFERDYKV